MSRFVVVHNNNGAPVCDVVLRVSEIMVAVLAVHADENVIGTCLANDLIFCFLRWPNCVAVQFIKATQVRCFSFRLLVIAGH